MNDFKAEIAAEIAAETARSRYRDRANHRRVHPIYHDFMTLINFVGDRRLRQPGATDLVRGALRLDTEAVRGLVDLVLTKGAYGRVMRRRCERILEYCLILETALAVARAMGCVVRGHASEEREQ